MTGTYHVTVESLHTYQTAFTTPDIEALLASSHLYIVSRAPRVRITEARCTPASYDLTLFNVATDQYIGEASSSFQGMRSTPQVQTYGNGRYHVVQSPDGTVLLHGSAWAWASLGTDRNPSLAGHQIIYIGQAFGRGTTGTRNTHVRTQAHSTIQRILAENEGADYDIFLTPLLIERGMFQSDDFLSEDDSNEPDLAKLGEFLDPASEHVYVDLAEQALIAYFKPEYNKMLLTWTGTSKAARFARAAGLRVFSLMLTQWHGLAVFYSSHRPQPRMSHHIQYLTFQNEDVPYERARAHADLTGAMDIQAFQISGSRPVHTMAGTTLPQFSPWDTPIPDERLMAHRMGSGRWRKIKVKRRTRLLPGWVTDDPEVVERATADNTGFVEDVVNGRPWQYLEEARKRGEFPSSR